MQLQLTSKDQEISLIRRHWGKSVAQIVVLLGVTGLMMVLTRRANIHQRERQWQITKNSELIASSSTSEALFYSEQQFEALLESLRAAEQLRDLLNDKPFAIAPSTQLKVLSTLEQSYFGLQEKNRLEGHRNSVVDVVVSPEWQIFSYC